MLSTIMFQLSDRFQIRLLETAKLNCLPRTVQRVTDARCGEHGEELTRTDLLWWKGSRFADSAACAAAVFSMNSSRLRTVSLWTCCTSSRANSLLCRRKEKERSQSRKGPGDCQVSAHNHIKRQPSPFPSRQGDVYFALSFDNPLYICLTKFVQRGRCGGLGLNHFPL